MSKRDTTIGRVPRKELNDLRLRFPGMNDADLWRMTCNLSAIKVEAILESKDVKNKLGKFVLGNLWKENKNGKR